MGMRPWERDQADAAAGSPMTPSPPQPSKTSLSSMVVRPSDNEGGGSGGGDDKGGGTGREKEVRQQKGEGSSPSPAEAHRGRSERFPEDTGYGRHTSPVSLRFQRNESHRYDPDYGNPEGLQRQRGFRSMRSEGGERYRALSPPYGRGRGTKRFSDISPSYERGRGVIRFQERSPSYGRGRSVGGFRGHSLSYGRGRGRGSTRDMSPTYGHQRGGERPHALSTPLQRFGGKLSDYSTTYEPEKGGGRFQGPLPVHERDRGGERIRNLSPSYGRERDGRSLHKGFGDPRSGLSPFREDSLNRNNPNLSPRVGDWICRNPTCGNLNFARRDYCNSCNRSRYEPGDVRPSVSPRRSYSGGPPQVSPTSRIPLPRTFPRTERTTRRETNGSYRSAPLEWVRVHPREPPIHGEGGRIPALQMHRGRPNYSDTVEFKERERFGRPLPHEWDYGERGRDELINERRYDRHSPRPRAQWDPDPRDRSRSPLRDQPRKDYHDYWVAQGRGDRRGMRQGRSDDVFK